MRTHLVIPDTQAKMGVPVDHLHWIGRYIVDQFRGEDLVVIHLGDHWDMPSLSSYDKGKKAMEGRRYTEDIKAGNFAFETLNRPLEQANAKARKNKDKQWWPERHFLTGNHEDRITRAAESDAQLEGLVTLEHLDTRGWQVHDFLDVVNLDGIAYCLAPHHRVLMADLTYKEVGKIEPGERILGFDEQGQVGLPRRYRTSVVNRTQTSVAPLYRVTLKNGHQFEVTANHGWLARSYGTTGWSWVRTSDLRPEHHQICHPFSTWTEDTSYEAGYVAGILDGEGHICKPNSKQGGYQLGFAQNAGRVLDKTTRLLDHLGVEYTVNDYSQGIGVRQVRITGTSADKLQLLGSVRAERLIHKFNPDLLGRVQTNGDAGDVVESVVSIGPGEMVEIETSTGTLIVDGYAHHNSHYFYNPMTGRPYAGSNLETRLKTIGHSFTMGHQQGLKWGRIDTTAGPHIGLIAGSCYLHDEMYMGPQGNHYWRGIVVCHEVEDGHYDPMMVSLDYLCRKYEGIRLDRYMREMGY